MIDDWEMIGEHCEWDNVTSFVDKSNHMTMSHDPSLCNARSLCQLAPCYAEIQTHFVCKSAIFAFVLPTFSNEGSLPDAPVVVVEAVLPPLWADFGSCWDNTVSAKKVRIINRESLKFTILVGQVCFFATTNFIWNVKSSRSRSRKKRSPKHMQTDACQILNGVA